MGHRERKSFKQGFEELRDKCNLYVCMAFWNHVLCYPILEDKHDIGRDEGCGEIKEDTLRMCQE